jgi:hypothetical protein
VIGGSRYLQGSTYVSNALTLIKKLISSSQLADDLLRAVTFALHGASPGQVWPIGKLSQGLVQFLGSTSDGWWPQPKPLTCSPHGDIAEAEGLEIQPLAVLSTSYTGTLPEYPFTAFAISPVGFKGHCPVLIERAAVLAIEHIEAEPLDVVAAFLQSLATSRCRLAGFGMGADCRPKPRGTPGTGVMGEALENHSGALADELPGRLAVSGWWRLMWGRSNAALEWRARG